MFLHGALVYSIVLCGFASTCGALPRDGSFGLVNMLSKSRAELVPLAWVGSVAEGGPQYEFRGTAEQILAQILEVNPDYTPITTQKTTAAVALDPIEVVDAVEPVKRAPRIIIDCNPSDDWFPAAVSQLAHEARYLKSLGDATCSAEAGRCARVSCSYNTAIYFCNLRRRRWGIPCSRLGQQVIDISQKCQTWDKDNKSDVSKGMLRVPGDYELWAGEANPDC